MNKRPLNTTVTHLLRDAFFLVLFFFAINLIRLSQAQPHPQSNSETSRNLVGNNNSAKTVVRVHDSAERPQIASPQQKNSATNAHAPSGTICGVESRAAHGQV